MKVTLVHADAAHVGRDRVPFDRVTLIERFYVGGDRRSGVAESVGIGFGVAYVLARLMPTFADPSGMILVIGAGIGAIVGGMLASHEDPADREWATIWQR
jgi:hypothetical protein